ncbi:unnamed protein product, partial [Brenthis ino]
MMSRRACHEHTRVRERSRGRCRSRRRQPPPPSPPAASSRHTQRMTLGFVSPAPAAALVVRRRGIERRTRPKRGWDARMQRPGCGISFY